jgi:DNA-binding MarR family transcriptional regulator
MSSRHAESSAAEPSAGAGELSAGEAAGRVEAALGLLVRRSTRAGLYGALVAGIEGLGETTYPVLSGLARLGPVTSTRLADEIGIDRTATTRYAGRLEAAGLLARTPDPSDARATLLLLTASGEAAVAAARERLTGRLAEVLAGRPPAERAVFAAVLEELVEALRGGPGR